MRTGSVHLQPQLLRLIQITDGDISLQQKLALRRLGRQSGLRPGSQSINGSLRILPLQAEPGPEFQKARVLGCDLSNLSQRLLASLQVPFGQQRVKHFQVEIRGLIRPPHLQKNIRQTGSIRHVRRVEIYQPVEGINRLLLLLGLQVYVGRLEQEWTGFAGQSLQGVELRQFRGCRRGLRVELDDFSQDGDAFQVEPFAHVGIAEAVEVLQRLGKVLDSNVEVAQRVEEAQVGVVAFENILVVLDGGGHLVLGRELFRLLQRLGFVKSHRAAP